MISRRALLGAAAAAPLASLLPRPALAAYPDKPIRLIVPFSAGGNADFVARVVAEPMQANLGQPIVIDYRTGALSICYLYFQREKQGDHEAIADQYVVCTPQWSQPATARQGGAIGQAPCGRLTTLGKLLAERVS